MKRLLIANRGEIARRVIRTARRMGIETVAVFSDVDAGALHVREATMAMALGGHASADSYLRIDKLLAAARDSGADAVHPGYGFLSENADFAQAVLDAGLIWVGPPPGAIRTLGSKASAKQLAIAHGVPVLPGYQGDDQNDARFAQEAERIGYPVMVKATAGGGGRGMRLVAEAAQLTAALVSARSEAQAAFGSAELLIERALLDPRHVEVQVFADAHGHCVHLGERDCSVQRRHQKIIEESPSPAVDAALRERLGACAVALARAAGYAGAGTVEFLLAADGPHAAAPETEPAEPAFYLMEMNTRLQVEHPVTEMRTGLDLVEWQLRVARGEALPLTQDGICFDGHAIEARLCAEDEEFRPHTGTVLHFREPPASASPPAGPAQARVSRSAGVLRFDHAIEAGLQVSPHYDSMLGKLIAHGPTRDAAIDSLRAALAQTELLGLPTNRALLAACLEHDDFRAGRARIGFMAARRDELSTALRNQEQAMVLQCGLAALFDSAMVNPLPPAFERPVRWRWRGSDIDWRVREHAGAGLDSDQAVTVQTGGELLTAALSRAGQHTRVRVGALAVTVAKARLGAGMTARRWHLQCGGADLLLDDTSHAPPAGAGRASGINQEAELRAPFNGRVIAVHGAAGDEVAAGDTLVVLEAMKLEHRISAPRAARLASLEVQAGQQVTPGQLLARFGDVKMPT